MAQNKLDKNCIYWIYFSGAHNSYLSTKRPHDRNRRRRLRVNRFCRFHQSSWTNENEHKLNMNSQLLFCGSVSRWSLHDVFFSFNITDYLTLMQPLKADDTDDAIILKRRFELKVNFFKENTSTWEKNYITIVWGILGFRSGANLMESKKD